MAEDKKYEFLEHTADVYVAVYGKSVEEAFENAAQAMFDTMTEIKQVEPKVEDHVKVKGRDCHALLYNWLEALLVSFETKGSVYSRFEVSNIMETPEGLKLEAGVWGEPYNADKHPQKVAIKAVTYHQMEIIRETRRITLKFILDI